MKRAMVMAASLVLLASAARAQYVPPQLPSYGSGQSSMSYINLVQPNVNPALTYMGIVQPQLQAQSNFQALQNEIVVNRMMPGGIAPPRNSGVSDTGFAPARFMQFQQYFNTMSNPQRMNYQAQPGTSAAGYGRR